MSGKLLGLRQRHTIRQKLSDMSMPAGSMKICDTFRGLIRDAAGASKAQALRDI